MLEYAMDTNGECTLCAEGHHDGGDGACVAEGTCAPAYALDLSGDCTLCAPGHHDGGNGSCVVEGACALGYHDGGDAACALAGTCSGPADVLSAGKPTKPEPSCVFL